MVKFLNSAKCVSPIVTTVSGIKPHTLLPMNNLKV